jgi:cell wall-associated NlpC family hydrolase
VLPLRPRTGLLVLALGLCLVGAAVLAGVASGSREERGTPASALRVVAAAEPGVAYRPRTAPAIPPLGMRAIRVARRFLGVPYRYGGASPAGFDCSGLVSYVYGRLGVALPHNAAALYSVGRPVPLARLRPGDLVFFSGLGHVGLAVGRGRYIHSPETGRSVEIASLAARAGTIVGARRVARIG